MIIYILIAFTLGQCKSGDEDPKDDYTWVNLLNLNTINGLYFEGTLEKDTCGADPFSSNCITYMNFPVTFFEGTNNNAYLDLNLNTSNEIFGTLTVILPMTDQVPKIVIIPINGTAGPQYETGGGVQRSLTLRQAGSAALDSPYQLSLISFTSQQEENRLPGTMTIQLFKTGDTGPISIQYVYSLTKKL